MSQFIEPKYRREALKNVPKGYAVLPFGTPLKADDLVWRWTTHEFLRADSERWLFSPLENSEDIICAVRKVDILDFEKSVPQKRNYTLR